MRRGRSLAGKLVALVLGATGLAMLAFSVTSLPPGTETLLFHGAFVDQGPSPNLTPGSSASYTMRFRNTGIAPWRRGVPSMQVDLAVASDIERFAEIRDGWLSAERVATTVEDVVPPGGVGTFVFSVRAPRLPGAYRMPLRLLVAGSTWLEDEPVALVVVSDLGFHSQLVDQSDHLRLQPGGSAAITVRLRNVGARSWIRGVAGQQVALGIAGDDRSLSSIGIGWPTPDRVAVQAEPAVPSGAMATFTFTVRAPTTSGTYALHLRPVIDGLMWLEDDGVMSLVDVVPAGASAATRPASPGAAQTALQNVVSGATVSPGTTAPGGTVRIDASFLSDAALTAIVG